MINDTITSGLRLILVGNRGGINIAESYARSAKNNGINVTFLATQNATSKYRLINLFSWKINNKRPIKQREFCNELLKVVENCEAKIILTTGMNPVTADILKKLKTMGVLCLHYSTDDPWNATQHSDWFQESLVEYNIIFSPRINNTGDFVHIGCKDVRYLPFAYDKYLFDSYRNLDVAKKFDVLFVGGADSDRVEFITNILLNNISIALVGGYWNKFDAVRNHSLGLKNPDEVAELTCAARVNLCLVRRANRDGHVMRSYEIAALGGCMIVEDTFEHRNIFGTEGDNVFYFNTPNEASEKIKFLLSNPELRHKLGRAVYKHITNGENTYDARLMTILNSSLNGNIKF